MRYTVAHYDAKMQYYLSFNLLSLIRLKPNFRNSVVNLRQENKFVGCILNWTGFMHPIVIGCVHSFHCMGELTVEALLLIVTYMYSCTNLCTRVEIGNSLRNITRATASAGR